MPQKNLFDFNPPPKKHTEENPKAEALPQQPTAEPEKKHKRHLYPPKAPDNLPASYFVSATYDGRKKKAVVKLYEPTSSNICSLVGFLRKRLSVSP